MFATQSVSEKYLLGVDSSISILADVNKDGKFNALGLLQIKSFQL